MMHAIRRQRVLRVGTVRQGVAWQLKRLVAGDHGRQLHAHRRVYVQQQSGMYSYRVVLSIRKTLAPARGFL